MVYVNRTEYLLSKFSKIPAILKFNYTLTAKDPEQSFGGVYNFSSPLVSHGPLWSPMVSRGLHWSPVVSHGLSRYPIVSHGLSRSPMVYGGLPCSPMTSRALPWSPVESNGLPVGWMSALPTKTVLAHGAGRLGYKLLRKVLWQSAHCLQHCFGEVLVNCPT